jgi:stage IV sporulation protein FB
VFFEPSETPYDLRWRMFNVPVRVHPMFWLISAALGWSATNRGMQYLLLWVLAVFVSILVHELGHVFMGRFFGTNGHIVLYSFGGLAIGSSNLRGRWQRVAVYFAGPGAGFLLAALLWFGRSLFTGNPLAAWLLVRLLEINIFWGLLNLLPIWPLDGGQVSREVCSQVFRWKGLNVSLGISIAVAGLLALVKSGYVLKEGTIDQIAATLPPSLAWVWDSLTSQDLFMAIFFAMMAASSFQVYQQESQRQSWREDEFPWAR